MSNNQLHQSTSVKSLAGYAKPYKMVILMVLLSLVITASCVLMLSEGLRIFIDSGLNGSNTDEMYTSLRYLVLIIIALAVFTFTRFYLVTYFAELVISDIRKDIFKRILAQPPTFYEKITSGEMISRMIGDTTILLTFISSSASSALRNLIMFCGGLILLTSHSVALTLMIILWIPLILLPLAIFGKRLKSMSRQSQDKVAKLTSHTEEVISLIKVVQSSNMQSFEFTKFAKEIAEQLQAAIKRNFFKGILSALLISISFTGIILILWYGGNQVILGNITAGELSAFIYVAIICASSLASLSEVSGEMQKARGAVEQVFSFLNSTESHQLPYNTDKIKVLGKIEFQNVGFAYNQQNIIFDDLNLTFEKGKTTAIIGKSGAGKTTIISLLLGFYTPSKGSIIIDGSPLTNKNIKSIRSQIAYVPQEPAIFSGTILENIKYGSPTATFAQVMQAAKQAQCLDFIESSAEKYETYVGSRGVMLSTGQKQRLMLARAFLKNPKIILLDEATSAIDTVNEELIQKALATLAKGRTVIIIAHQLSTIQSADKIMVLDGGSVFAEGNHHELLTKKNKYYAQFLKHHLVNNA